MEKWKMIKKFPDYAVSDQGRVKRITPGKSTYVGRLCKLKTNEQGYQLAQIRHQGKGILIRVHSQVLRAFEREPIGREESNHKDGIKSNNYLWNLEWLTHKENVQHAWETGLCKAAKGEAHGGSKLKEGEIWLIRKIAKERVITQVQIARMFQVSLCLIEKIIARRLWKHIQ